MKRCTKCLNDLVLSNFRKRKNHGKEYIVAMCINCERTQKKNCEKLRYLSFTQEQKKKHFKTSKVAAQKESYKQWHRAWQKDKENNDIGFKLKRRIGSLIRSKLRKHSVGSFYLLEYTVLELRLHLESLFESWMNWDNYGVYNINSWDDDDSTTWTWQIDHVVPVSSFHIESVGDDEFKKCWNLKNLRPLSSKQNILKGSK